MKIPLVGYEIVKSAGRRQKASGDFDKLRRQVEEAREYKRQEIHPDWETYREYYSSDGQRTRLQAGIKDEDLKKCAVVSNFVFSSTEAYTAMLLLALPDWFVVSPDAEHEEQAATSTDYLQAWYETRKVLAQYETMTRDAIILGTGALKVFWDPHAEQKSGEVGLQAVDPFQIFVDPSAAGGDLEHASMICSRNVYSEELLSRLWPNADLTRLSTASISDDDDPSKPQTEPANRRIEVWEVIHDFGDSLTIYSADQVLQEGANPTPKGRYPYFFFRMHPQTGQFWGKSAVAWVTDLQDEINRTRTRIAIHHKFTAPPILLTDDQGLQVDFTATRILRLKTPGAQAKFLEPPSLPNDIMSMLMRCQADFDTIFGVQDVTRGVRPKGATSGIMVESLQQGAQTRLSGPMRAWGHTHREVGQTVLETMQQRYAEPRTIALMGPTSGRRVGITPDDLSASDVGVPEGEEPLAPEPYDLRVVCSTRTDLPRSQQAEAQLAVELGQMGFVDQEAVLEATRFPGRRGVMERAAAVAEQAEAGREAALQDQAQQAQAEQMMAQGMPPGVDQAPPDAMMRPAGP